jgi:hypothetical protein
VPAFVPHALSHAVTRISLTNLPRHGNVLVLLCLHGLLVLHGCRKRRVARFLLSSHLL